MFNKRLMLLALPILMVLSSCNNVSINNKDIDFIKEDTSITNKIFGQVKESYTLNNKAPKRAVEDLVEPMIGVQFKSYTEGGNNYYAVRYVAAIKSLDVTATWTRAVSSNTGSELKGLESGISATKAYKTLNNGGVISTCSVEYPGYEYYLVYTMYDIPNSSINGNAYMMAYLTLSYGEASPVKSKAVVTQIKGTGHTFSFDIDSVTNDYFIDVHHTEGEDTIYYGEEGEEKLNPAENDRSIFTNKAFVSGDTFGLFKYTGSAFTFCDNPTYLGSTASRFAKTPSNRDNYGQLYLPGSYSLFVNHEDRVYMEATDVLMTITFAPNTDWLSDYYDETPRFALYAFGGTAGTEWFSLSKVGATSTYRIENFNIGTHTTIIFCRMDGRSGHEANDWANKVNQTGNIVINSNDGPTNLSFKKYTLSNEKSGGDTWDNFTGSWSA